MKGRQVGLHYMFTRLLFHSHSHQSQRANAIYSHYIQSVYCYERSGKRNATRAILISWPLTLQVTVTYFLPTAWWPLSRQLPQLHELCPGCCSIAPKGICTCASPRLCARRPGLTFLRWQSPSSAGDVIAAWDAERCPGRRLTDNGQR